MAKAAVSAPQRLRGRVIKLLFPEVILGIGQVGSVVQRLGGIRPMPASDPSALTVHWVHRTLRQSGEPLVQWRRAIALAVCGGLVRERAPPDALRYTDRTRQTPHNTNPGDAKCQKTEAWPTWEQGR